MTQVGVVMGQVSQEKSIVWTLAALKPSALHVEKFSMGKFGCI
jgi:hypothetical protein